MNISIYPYRMTIVLFATIIVLALAYFGAWYVHNEYQRFDKIYRVFDFDSEGNIPSLFSALLLLSSSVLFGMLASIEKRSNRQLYPYWVGLCVIFFYLFLDEGAGLHECMGSPVRGLLRGFGFNVTGVFYVAWFIPFIVFLFFFIILFSKFLFQINYRLKLLMILAGVIYVTGSIGFEMLACMQFDFLGISSSHYLFLVITLEEFLEMAGVVLLNYSLVEYMATQHGKYDITMYFKTK